MPHSRHCFWRFYTPCTTPLACHWCVQCQVHRRTCGGSERPFLGIFHWPISQTKNNYGFFILQMRFVSGLSNKSYFCKWCPTDTNLAALGGINLMKWSPSIIDGHKVGQVENYTKSWHYWNRRWNHRSHGTKPNLYWPSWFNFCAQLPLAFWTICEMPICHKKSHRKKRQNRCNGKETAVDKKVSGAVD